MLVIKIFQILWEDVHEGDVSYTCMCGGRLFQAATENARSPSVEWVRGTAMDSNYADLRQAALLLAMEVGTTSSAR